MSVPSNVESKKSKVYIQKISGEYLQIHPETFTESEIVDDSLWPVSSHALKTYSDSIEERIAPFAGATASKVGKIGTVPQAEIGDRNSFLRGDGRWTPINIIDEKVKCTLNKARKFYILGTDIADNNTGQALFDTGVFVSDQPGELHATKVVGNIEGNVVGNLDGIAERAKRDAEGNVISEQYATVEMVAGTYSEVEHTHSTSDILSLSGYAKANAAELSDDDTLNQALGKLETRIEKAATMYSPSLDGVPTTPTPTNQSVSIQIANKEYVDNKISELIGGAGAAFDTLNELKLALGSDPDFANTMTSQLGSKLDKTSANYAKSISISDNTTGSGQILKIQRGDDTTYTLAIKDTIIQPSDDEPKAPAAAAAAGASVKYSRGDHVHPLQTSLIGTPAGTTWVAGATSGKALVNSTATSYGAILNASTKNYKIGLSTYPGNNDLVYLYSVANANVSAGTNTVNKQMTWNAADGTLTANAFVGVFPANTRMLFQQSAAPTGWTKETDTAYNDKALRFVTGNIANRTNGKAFSTCMATGRASANASPGGTIANASPGGTIANATQGGTLSSTATTGTVGNKSLSVAMLAAHTHTVANVPNTWKHLVDGDDVGFQGIQSFATKTSSSTGSGSAHNHSFTGSSHTHTFTGKAHTHTFTGTAHSHTFTGSSHSHTIDMNINYIDCIIAKKA